MDFDILDGFPRPDLAVVQQAAQYAPSILADVDPASICLPPRIRPLDRHMRVAGAALTVCVPAGDNLMIHAAISQARPGDVLVIDAGGQGGSAVMGNIMAAACRRADIGGIVIDGMVRDSLELIADGLPVFACGSTPVSASHCRPGTVGHVITLGDTTVHPGDFIVGDADGVLVVRRERLAQVLPLADARRRQEKARVAAIEAGAIRPDWLDEALSRARSGMVAQERSEG